MNKNLEAKIKIILGIIIIIINMLWAAFFIELLYAYHFTASLWLYMFPDWILIFNVIVSIIGIYLGYLLIRNKIATKSAMIVEIPLFLLSLLLSVIWPM